jgi:predicted transcriptional regulator
MRYTTAEKTRRDKIKFKKAAILVSEGYSLQTTAKYLGFSPNFLKRQLDALQVKYKINFTDKGE